MSGTRRRRPDAAILLVVLGIAAWTTATTLGFQRPVGQPPLRGTDVVWAASFSAFLALGALVARRRPENPVGWLLAAGPVCIGAGVACFEYVYEPARPTAAWVGLVADPLFDLGVLLLTLWPLWYPDGRLPSPRWRWVVRAALTAYAVSVVTGVLTPTPYAMGADLRSPLALDAALLARADQVVDTALPLLLVAGFGSLIVRFRTGGAAAREQLKVLVYAVSVVAAAAVALTVVSRAVGPSEFLDAAGVTLNVAALLCVPLAVAVAVVRHRAFDIDRAISRTLSYAIVTGVLVGVYAGSVLGLGAVARSVAGETGDLVVALSTLAVAAAFAPVRRRVQSGVDRRFNRGRVDALHAVDEFGRRLRDEVDLAAVVADLRRTVVRTLEPSSASVLTVLPTVSTSR